MKLYTSIFIAAGIIALISSCGKKKRPSIRVGDQAPEFRLQDETGAWRTLEEFRGQKVVLYFYPHDETPGCTKQACSVRNKADMYAKHNIVVLGINYDSPESHAAFKEKYRLPFILLSDMNRDVARAYGAKSNIPLLGRYMPNRFTYLIDERGTLVKKLEEVDVATFAEDVLKAFETV